MSEIVNADLLPEEVLDQTFKSFRSIIPYDRIGCSVIEDDGRRVRAVWARADAPTSNLEVGYSAQYLREHPESRSTRLILADGVRSSLTCPLVGRGRPIGFVFFSSNRPGTYSRRHVESFTRIAGQLALVIEKGRLYADLLQAKKGLEAAKKKLNEMATLDGLTGVSNRRTMDEMLRLAWRRAAHVAGDNCLIQVAKETRGALKRPDDFIARYGGEEFLAFPSQTPVDAATGLAERLRLLVAELPINAVSGGSVAHLIASADRALYSAKTAGRDRVARADSVQPAW